MIDEAPRQITLLELINVISDGSPEQQLLLAEKLGPMFDSRQSTKSRQELHPRIQVSSAEIDSLDDGTEVWGGPSRFPVVDFLGATGYIDRYDRNTAHIRTAGGGADCMFDYLVSTCWAAEVTAGRGTEGQVFTSLTGCTFKVYSTVQGACTAADTDFTGSEMPVIFICSGYYSENVTLLTTARIVGAGYSVDSSKGDTSSEQAGVVIAPAAAGDTFTFGTNSNDSIMENVRVNGRTAAEGTAAIRIGNPAQITVRYCSVSPGNASNYGIMTDTSNNHFDWITVLGSVGTGIILQTGGAENYVTHLRNDSSIDVALEIGDGAHYVSDIELDSPNIGILFSGSGSQASVTDGIITDATTGVSIVDGTKIIVDGLYCINCATGIKVAVAMGEDLVLINNKFDLDTGSTNVGIDIVTGSGWNQGLIKGNIFWDNDGAAGARAIQGTTNGAIGGWSHLSDNWYNGGPLFASSVGARMTGLVIRWSDNTNNEVEWDQFLLLFGATLLTVAAGEITLTASSTNYIEVDSAGTVSKNTTSFTAGQFPLGIATTSSVNPTLWQPSAPILSHGGLASGTAAAPSPHNLVSGDHDGEQDYTNTLGLLGLGVGIGDLIMYSDAGVTKVGTWDAATGHIVLAGSGAPGATTIIEAVKSFTNPAAAVLAFNTSLVMGMSGAGNANDMTGAYAGLAASGSFTASGLWASFKGEISRIANAPTVNDYRGVYLLATPGASMTLVDRYGVYIADGTGAGAITNQYGIYIANMAKGGTLNRAIKSLGGVSEHLGAFTIGANAAPNAMAILDLVSTTQGLLIPRLATASRPAGVNGLIYYDSTTNKFVAYENGAYLNMIGGGGGAVATDVIWDLLGDTVYATGPDAAVRLAGNITTTKKFLRQTGTGAASAAPAWDTVLAADVIATGMKQTLILTAGGGTPTTTAPCGEKQKVEFGTNDRDVWVLDFDSATKEYAFWDFAMPANWDAGTVTAIFHWLANDATTNGVRWGLQAIASGDGEALDAAYGTAQEVTDNQASTANQCRISAATAAITVAGTPAAGDTITFRAYRDPANAGDTLAVDARLMKIVVLYGITTLSA